jgi:tRNA threonylcarbamoyladenosine biosynthesis protein TsaB
MMQFRNNLSLTLLAIETSSDVGSVCVLSRGEYFLETSPANVKLSAWVIAAIDRVLQCACVMFSDLDAVAFGAGPGAFTGVRTACATAQGLAYAHELPLIAIDSLQAMAALTEKEWSHGVNVTVLIDARINQLYVAEFFRDKMGIIARVSETRLIDTKTYEPKTPQSIFIGSGVSAWRKDTDIAFVQLAESQTREIEARWACGVANVAMNVLTSYSLAVPKQLHTVDPIDAQPIYVRNNVAQTERERAQQRLSTRVASC